jgi:hypothetical protein
MSWVVIEHLDNPHIRYYAAGPFGQNDQVEIRCMDHFDPNLASPAGRWPLLGIQNHYVVRIDPLPPTEWLERFKCVPSTTEWKELRA